MQSIYSLPDRELRQRLGLRGASAPALSSESAHAHWCALRRDLRARSYVRGPVARKSITTPKCCQTEDFLLQTCGPTRAHKRGPQVGADPLSDRIGEGLSGQAGQEAHVSQPGWAASSLSLPPRNGSPEQAWTRRRAS